MISMIDTNKGMLSVSGITGVEIVGMPVESQLLVHPVGFLEGHYVTVGQIRGEQLHRKGRHGEYLRQEKRR